MKTYCKKIDITDVKTITPFVGLCLSGKQNRTDFGKLLEEYGDAEGIAKEIVKRINARSLDLKPIRFFNRVDGMSGKVRELGVEEPLQVCMDYVAVHALMPLFKAKIGYYQCASLPKKGQVFGKKAIERWVNGDFKHSNKYVKVDVRHCYKSIKQKIVMKYLRRDVKNETLLWFVEALINTHGDGLSIGSYLSQYLCNYLLSYVYHYATESLFKYRRQNRIRLCYHVCMFMDDILLTGNDKRNLLIAAKSIDKYLRENMDLHLKPNWSVKNVLAEPIDMMGFVIHYGYTTIRAGIFLRARRAFMRLKRKIDSGIKLNLKQCKRVIAYYGFFKHSNSVKIRKKLDADTTLKAACLEMSKHDKEVLIYDLFYRILTAV